MVHLVPNYHLAGSPLELCQVPLGVPVPQFGNHCSSQSEGFNEWLTKARSYMYVRGGLVVQLSSHLKVVEPLHFSERLRQILGRDGRLWGPGNHIPILTKPFLRNRDKQRQTRHH